jgi:hypothetical protein
MTDYRWVLISRALCNGGIRISGSGTIEADGDYCPDGTENGKLCWTKIGGTRLFDSIYWTDSPAEWTIRVNNEAVYVSISAGTIPGNWITAAFGTFPPPSNVFKDEQILRDFGPLQYARFSEDEDLSVGLIAKRRKLTTDIVFSGDHYNFFRAIEKDPVRRCEELIIRRQMKCGSKWETIWTGTFSTGSGSWDLDKCLFTVRPEVLDEYTCIMQGMNTKKNLLDLDDRTITGAIAAQIQRIVSVEDLSSAGFYEAINFPDPRDPSCTIYVWWREYVELPCSSGSPVAPSSGGWTLLNNSCSVLGYASWVRSPTLTWTYGTPTAGSYPIPDLEENPIPPDNSCDWVPAGTISSSAGCYDGVTYLDYPLPYYVCGPFIYSVIAHERSVTNAIRILDIMNELLDGCELTVRSDFFEIDPVGDAPGYVSGDNYIKGGANQLANLYLVQMSNALLPGATNPATKGEMTPKEMFSILGLFRIFWRIEDGTIRLEHWHHWVLKLNEGQVIELKERMAYEWPKADFPKQERISLAFARERNFAGTDILYTGPCTESDDGQPLKEYRIPQIVTDWPTLVSAFSNQYIADSFPKEGFFLVAADASDDMFIDDGAINGVAIGNGPLAIANIMRDYWTWDRPLPSGTMNGRPVVFDGIQPTIKQTDSVALICCDILQFDSSLTVATKLGQKLGGIRGVVNKAEFDEKGGVLTLTLKYPY